MNHSCKFAAVHATSSGNRFPARSLLAAFCALTALLLFSLPTLAAQTTKPSPSIPQKPAATQTHTSLADQPPAAATVTFRNGKLAVKSRNSELLQILEAITAQTGMKVQGAPGNHRVFGTYGPGQPREVLSQLLTGFDFNYLLVGTAHNGAPQKLILAGQAASGPEPSQPVHSVQPAPQNTGPRPQYHPSPFYQPKRTHPAPRKQPKGHSPHPANAAHPANAPHRVRTPQQILKELEALHAKQKQGSSH